MLAPSLEAKTCSSTQKGLRVGRFCCCVERTQHVRSRGAKGVELLALSSVLVNLRICKRPLLYPKNYKKHPFCRVSQAFVFVWRFVQVGWWAMILNLNHYSHYSGLFFSSEFTGCPGATSTCLTSPSNRPMRKRKYAYSNCCYTTKLLWPLIYVYQPACGDSKWGYVKFMASKTCCSLD
jgi:hypothetical protein